ncbi:MAG: redoxin domain-containing protein [Planctomycetaceae bacterium]
MNRNLTAACVGVVLLGAVGSSVTAVRAAEEIKVVAPTKLPDPKSPVGRKVENFTLKDYRGKTHSLDDYKSSKLVVIAFLGTECPLAKLYSPRLQELSASYKPEDVAFLGIDANRQDSITEIAAFARTHGVAFPILKDLSNHVADQMLAVRTPEVYLLDGERVIRYWGRIDDQYGVGYTRKEPSRSDLKAAIDQLLTNHLVEVLETQSAGCRIGRVHAPKEDSAITYSNQIARLLQKRCAECHRANEIAPFALTDYEEVVGWAEMIAEVVREERMPPWHASPEHGEFTDDRRLSDDEKELIYQWVAAGAPQGDPKQLPEPLKYTEGWQLSRQPDVVINMNDEPFTVPAEGVVEYKFFRVDPGFTEDKWVTESEIIPGNKSVVHHVLVFVREPGERRRENELAFLAAFVPGLRAKPFPTGMAKRVPAGSQLVFQMHYTPNGTEQADMSKMGLIFADPKDVTHIVKTTEAIHRTFEIPAGADNYMVEASSPRYDRELLLLRLMPHMHLRGKSFHYEARFPDGKTQTLLDVPRYDFSWQTTYRLKEGIMLPKGTAIHCVAHFDNSENNLNNPDPTVPVKWGDQTWEEMMIGFYEVAVPVDAKSLKPGAPFELQPTPESTAQRIIEGFDKNKDGKVSRSEVPLRAQAFFLRMDANSDGEITVEEVVKAMEQQQKPQKQEQKKPQEKLQQEQKE